MFISIVFVVTAKYGKNLYIIDSLIVVAIEIRKKFVILFIKY